MELQYAMFCDRVDFPKEPRGLLLLIKPVVNLAVKQDVSDIEFPLFLTFLNCTIGTHDFRVEVSDFSGEVIATRDFNFTCVESFLSRAECFVVKFPIHKTDLLIFSLYLDGLKQGQIKLPVKVKVE